MRPVTYLLCHVEKRHIGVFQPLLLPRILRKQSIVVLTTVQT